MSCNRTVSLRTSRDGGYVFTDWRTQDLGNTGSFLKELIFRRLGRGKHWTIETCVQSAAPHTLISGAVQTD